MTLILLDPNLKDPHGHHMEWDFAIAAEARARGEDAIVFAHRDCRLPSQNGLEIVPLFSHTAYEQRSADPVTGKFDSFSYYNDVLAEELAAIPRERLRVSDAVLIPTLTENHLAGYVSWMRTFDPARAPLFVVYLMFPSGLSVAADGETKVADPFQALFYKLAFRRAAEPGAAIHFFGGGRQLAQEFSELSETKIEAHPIPIDMVSRRSRRHVARPTALLFAGDAKADKGFMLVPELADRLCAQFPHWRFLVHANSGPAYGPALAALNRLTGDIAQRHRNLVVYTERLSKEDYLALMDEADCLVSTYDPVVYARKSSGVVWEAISLGAPMLAPAQTWLEKEAREWGAGYATYATHSVAAICDSFAEFAPRLPDLVAKSAEAAKSFQVHNGVRALVNQIGRLWAPRMLAATLVPQPTATVLPLVTIEKEGWSFPETLDGKIVRWVGKSFEIEFSWPFDAPWQLEVEAARCISAEQVREATAFAEDQPLAASGRINADEISGVVSVAGLGDRRRPQQKVRIELPWTHRPPDDSRDLGILVQGVRVSPRLTSAEAANEDGKLEILSKVERSEQGFLLQSVVSGRAAMDPRRANWLHFTVRTAGGPKSAHEVELHVNGLAASLDRVAVSGEVWLFRAKCNPEALAPFGLWANWDLALSDSARSAVWIDQMRVSGVEDFAFAFAPPAAPAAVEERPAVAAPIPAPILAPAPASPAPAPSVKQTLFTARDIPDSAYGFYEIEPMSNGSAIRWTGPSRESMFMLDMERSFPIALIVRFASLGQNRFDQVSIKVDDKVYPLSADSPEKDTYCVGPIGSAFNRGATRVVLRVEQTMRPWEAGSADGRELGVALEWMRTEKWVEPGPAAG